MATFEQAMTKTSAEAASSTSRIVRAGAAIWSRSGVTLDLEVGASPGTLRGARASWRRARAAARRAPLRGWRPAPAGRRARSSGARGSVTIVADRWCGLVTTLAMISVSAGYGTDGSRTPTIVAVRVPSRMVLPTTDGSLLRVVRPEAVGQHRRARRVRAVVGRVRAGGRAPGAGPSPRSTMPPTTPACTTRGSPRPTIVKSMVEKSPKALIVVTRDSEVADFRHRERQRSRRRCRARSGGCRSGDLRRD